MGRMKGLFCAFCLEKNSDETNDDHSYNQGIDVSHLATPHISSNPSLVIRSSANSTPVCENNNEENFRNFNQEPTSNQANCAINRQSPLESVRVESSDHDSNNFRAPQDHDRSHSPSQQGPPSQLNHYEPQSSLNNQPQQQIQRNHIPAIPQQQQPQASTSGPPGQNGTSAKLSYDIISVREPLAKILAERQQLHQQRQILGDHEYIEVYGERGSSCFYEEIAGSTTSSATYDQIGAQSNHNYQVLRNAYAINYRPDGIEGNDNEAHQSDSSQNLNGDSENGENMYDVTHPIDQTDNVGRPETSNPQPSTSYDSAPIYSKAVDRNHDQFSVEQSNELVSHQSIPVYSVINKATRRSNAIIRATGDSCRPPKPPPKNLSLSHQPSTSAIQNNLIQTPSNHNGINDNQSPHSRLPQPPPRLSKRSVFNATNRPLPLPESFESPSNNSINNRDHEMDDDVESIDNGYELLSPNFDDEQIDVGYERIRESNRYSGGSMSSQFCPLQALDNGGYESLQPIYSSPSNALAEPNYEAIGPATASELAAAATARLTAAAAAIEKLMKKD